MSRINLISEKIKKSIPEMAKELNYSKELLYMIESGARNISKKLANKIENIYGIPREYTLTGTGDLIINPDLIFEYLEVKNIQDKITGKINSKLIPFYNDNFSRGNIGESLRDDQIKPEYYMDVPEFAGCIAFRLYSDNMANLIPSGSILFASELKGWDIYLEYGQIYGIRTLDGLRFVKYIKKATDCKKCFLLSNENPKYDNFEMPIRKIKEIWIIQGWIKKNT